MKVRPEDLKVGDVIISPIGTLFEVLSTHWAEGNGDSFAWVRAKAVNYTRKASLLPSMLEKYVYDEECLTNKILG